MKLKIYIAITFAVLALAGCHILQKDKLTLKKLDQKEEIQVMEQRNTFSRQSQLVLIDSNHHDFTLMLWPKGKFTFNIANGFVGEAERIMIVGKHTSQKTLKVTDKIEQDSTMLKANYIKEKESITTIKKNKLKVGYNWGWVLILPLLYVLYWLYKRV